MKMKQQPLMQCPFCEHVYKKYSEDIEAQHLAYECPKCPADAQAFAKARIIVN